MNDETKKRLLLQAFSYVRGTLETQDGACVSSKDSIDPRFPNYVTVYSKDGITVGAKQEPITGWKSREEIHLSTSWWIAAGDNLDDPIARKEQIEITLCDGHTEKELVEVLVRGAEMLNLMDEISVPESTDGKVYAQSPMVTLRDLAP